MDNGYYGEPSRGFWDWLSFGSAMRTLNRIEELAEEHPEATVEELCEMDKEK